MGWNSAAVMNQLVAILTGIAGINRVYKGIPQTIDARVTVSVTAGGQRIEFDAFHHLERMAGYFVEFAYRTQGDVAAAEDEVTDFLDRFLLALYADPTLGGACDWIDADFGLVNDPAYRPTAGLEYRVMPVVIWARQTNAA